MLVTKMVARLMILIFNLNAIYALKVQIVQQNIQ